MKRLLLLTIIALFAFTLSACSGGQEAQLDAKLKANIVEKSDAKDAKVVKFTATNWKWDKDVYTIKANEPVTLELDNKSGYHGIDILDTGVTIVMDKPQTLVFKKAGEYTIKCSVICGMGHEDMVSKLVVE